MIIPSLPAPPPKRINPWAIVLAVAIVVAMAPAIFRFQEQRLVQNARRNWRMLDLANITQTEATRRFGPPFSVHDYDMAQGVFAGPNFGPKHYYPTHAAAFAAQTQKAEVIWTFPQYTTIREIVWQLPDSYLTLWLHEPRAEMTLGPSDTIELTLPGHPGDWIALDNYRVGKDIVPPPARRR